MKKVLVTGSSSYIGNKFQQWLWNWPNDFTIHKISVRNDEWRKEDFSQYDVILHVAALVHKKEKKETKEQYFSVNRDLTLEIARVAKSRGVRQFIFMSTMAVYGKDGGVREETIITEATQPRPDTFYGQSKLEAEQRLTLLNDDNFKVAVLRPPMVYGPGCPGNYARLERLASIITVFPLIENRRSVIHINQLSETLREIIEHNNSGLFFPQNKQYMNTSRTVQQIARELGRDVHLSRTLGFIISALGGRIRVVRKVFGSLVYQVDQHKGC